MIYFLRMFWIGVFYTSFHSFAGSTLTLVDGTVVLYAPNLWTSSPALLAPIIKDQNGTTTANRPVYTNTTGVGLPNRTDNGGNCVNWTNANSGNGYGQLIGNSSVQGLGWINTGAGEWCEYYGARASLYCIEQ